MANAVTIIYCPECKLHRAPMRVYKKADGTRHFILDCSTEDDITRFHAVPCDEATGMTMEEVM